MTKTTNDPMAGLGEPIQAQQVSFGKVGDWIRGIKTDEKSVEVEGRATKIYEFLAHGGIFHAVSQDDEGNLKVSSDETVLNSGDYYFFWGKKSTDEMMRKISIGQVFGATLTEIKKSKNRKHKPFKNIIIRPGPMDPNYQGQTAADTAVPTDEEE